MAKNFNVGNLKLLTNQIAIALAAVASAALTETESKADKNHTHNIKAMYDESAEKLTLSIDPPTSAE